MRLLGGKITALDVGAGRGADVGGRGDRLAAALLARRAAR